jgi:hypothetical protein
MTHPSISQHVGCPGLCCCRVACQTFRLLLRGGHAALENQTCAWKDHHHHALSPPLHLSISFPTPPAGRRPASQVPSCVHTPEALRDQATSFHSIYGACKVPAEEVAYAHSVSFEIRSRREAWKRAKLLCLTLLGRPRCAHCEAATVIWHSAIRSCPASELWQLLRADQRYGAAGAQTSDGQRGVGKEMERWRGGERA